MTMNELQEILEKAREDMCKNINSFGTVDEILKLLIKVLKSRQDYQ